MGQLESWHHRNKVLQGTVHNARYRVPRGNGILGAFAYEEYGASVLVSEGRFISGIAHFEQVV